MLCWHLSVAIFSGSSCWLFCIRKKYILKKICKDITKKNKGFSLLIQQNNCSDKEYLQTSKPKVIELTLCAFYKYNKIKTTTLQNCKMK